MAKKPTMIQQGQKAGEKFMGIMLAFLFAPIILAVMYDKYPGLFILALAIMILGGIIWFREWRQRRTP